MRVDRVVRLVLCKDQAVRLVLLIDPMRGRLMSSSSSSSSSQMFIGEFNRMPRHTSMSTVGFNSSLSTQTVIVKFNKLTVSGKSEQKKDLENLPRVTVFVIRALDQIRLKNSNSNLLNFVVNI